MRRGALGPTVARAPLLAAASQNSCPTTCPAALTHHWEQRALREAGSVLPNSTDEKLRQNSETLAPRHCLRQHTSQGWISAPRRLCGPLLLPGTPALPFPSLFPACLLPGIFPTPATALTIANFKGFNGPSVLSSTHLPFQLDLWIHTTHLG